MKGDEEKCRDAGMDDYLTKPLERTKLIECMRRHLESCGSVPDLSYWTLAPNART
jgi:CheY-like chemotaxis protein